MLKKQKTEQVKWNRQLSTNHKARYTLFANNSEIGTKR